MIKGACLGNVGIDCQDAQKLQNFYAELLGWEKCEMYGCPAVCAPSGIVFLFDCADYDYIQPVWPEQPGYQQKQMHFDFQVDDLPTAVIQAESIGAVKADSQYGGDNFVTLFDPEGHPFCLCAK
jgi:predicted enzyme related to lactoylglutathione lyase